MKSDTVNFVISILVPTAVFALIHYFDPDGERLGNSLGAIIFYGSALVTPFIVNRPSKEEVFGGRFKRIMLNALVGLIISMYLVAEYFNG